MCVSVLIILTEDTIHCQQLIELPFLHNALFRYENQLESDKSNSADDDGDDDALATAAGLDKAVALLVYFPTWHFLNW